LLFSPGLALGSSPFSLDDSLQSPEKGWHHDRALPTEALQGESLYDAAWTAAPRAVITTNADSLKVPLHRYRPDLVNYERKPVDRVRAVEFGRGARDERAVPKDSTLSYFTWGPRRA
jgi:hypothetical protein